MVEDRDLESKELEIERQRARRGRQWAMDCQTETVSKISFELLFAKKGSVCAKDGTMGIWGGIESPERESEMERETETQKEKERLR